MNSRGGERGRFLQMLDEEIERRRRAVLISTGGDPRDTLARILGEMGRRLQADPHYRPPTAAQDKRAAHKIEMSLRRRGYRRTS